MALKKGTYKYTKKEIVDNIKYVRDALGHVPKQREYCRHPLCICTSRQTLRQRFGNWEAFLIEQKILPPAGYKRKILHILYEAVIAHPEASLHQAMKMTGYSPDRTYYKRFGSLENIATLLYQTYGLKVTPRKKGNTNINTDALRERLLEDYKRIRTILNRPPGYDEYHKMTHIVNLDKQLQLTFKKFSNLALAAGDVIKRGRIDIKVRKQYCIQCLKSAIEELRKAKQPITARNALRFCPVSAATIHETFGSYRKWFEDANVSWRRTYKYPLSTKKEILASMCLAANGKQVLTLNQYLRSPHNICTKHTIFDLFGSWYNAVHKAGLKTQKRHGKLYTNKEILLSLQQVAQQTNNHLSMSRYRKLKDKTMASDNTICNRFGSWDNALKAAGLI